MGAPKTQSAQWEKRPEGLLGSIERAVLALSIIGMSVLVMGNVISRNVFGVSWAFTEELGSLLLIVITFGGLGYAVRHRRHISMSALHDMLPPRRRAVLGRVIAAVSALILFSMVYIGSRYVLQIAESGDTSNVLGIPLYVPLSVIPLGFFLAAVRYLIVLFSPRGHAESFETQPGSERDAVLTGEE